ncbi:MAG: hypothetical protein JWQ91_597 [Aeromicrobium sp.]|uniref:SSI family serine proteinase inhibitor n=1 Tax=Aeromicrobium sp. TaxID=1871063 RepID=UPI0026284167|nr:SSI family serine proteinase inhibitor [Aeromicrobium sp.]MCW2790576.1 hypothetical protein [Aeromicrobium sp.]MCW2823680.1 hypothetical protein [Aeromicrobium sp.]
MRRYVLTLVAGALLAGCSGSGDTGGWHANEPDGSTTALTIVVTPDAEAASTTYTLTCDPAGGDHPQPEQACGLLANLEAGVLDPVPADRACTEVYGGPQTATVTGTYDGEDVSATFDRTNGCEIDRWEQLGTTFFAVPLQ